MWNPEQKRDKEIPHRGELSRQYPKRWRQIRNLKSEKRANILTLLGVFAFLVAIPICLIFNPHNGNNSNRLGQIVSIFIIALILIMPIASGLFSVNKFRKGHDIDVSKDTDEDKKLDEAKNLDS
jgi:hypothetical protein